MSKVLCVSNLPDTVDSYMLKRFFEQYGFVSNVEVKKKKTEVIGYLTFEKEESVIKAIDAMDGSDICGNIVKVQVLSRHSRKVSVGNLDESVDDAALNAYFSKCGSISMATVKKDANGKSLGCGIVKYKKSEYAEKAIETLNNTGLSGKKIVVERHEKKPKPQEPEPSN